MKEEEGRRQLRKKSKLWRVGRWEGRKRVQEESNTGGSLEEEHRRIHELGLCMKHGDAGCFGELDFQRGEERLPRYMCVSDETDVMDCWDLLDSCWKLRKPFMLLSVTGSADGLRLEPWMRKRFQRALATAVECSDAWVITGGTDSGVMELVGTALGSRSEYPTHSAERPHTIIGVVPWKSLPQMHQTELQSQRRKAEMRGLYNTTVGGSASQDKLETVRLPRLDDRKAVQLEPNHTHFLLVDSGREGRTWGSEIALRSELERWCSLQHSVPLILIVLQGGEGTFQTAAAALGRSGCQAIFVRDSGGCAEIVSNCVEPLLQLDLKAVTNEDGKRAQQIKDRLDE